MPYLLFLKKRQNLKLSFAANYRFKEDFATSNEYQNIVYLSNPYPNHSGMYLCGIDGPCWIIRLKSSYSLFHMVHVVRKYVCEQAGLGIISSQTHKNGFVLSRHITFQ